MKVYGIKGWHDPHVRAKPTPSADVYDAWLRSRNRFRHSAANTSTLTGQKLRRAVIMRKQGEIWKDIGYAIGHDPKTVRQWLEFLPLELQP